jgi:hypothetical protein
VAIAACRQRRRKLINWSNHSANRACAHAGPLVACGTDRYRGSGSTRQTLTLPAVTGARGLAAVLHAANHATHLANIAAAAFTANRRGEDEQVLNWSGLALTSRLAIGLLAIRKGMATSAVQLPAFPSTGPL